LLNEQGTDRFDGAMKLAFKIYDSSGEGKGLNKADLSRLLRRVCTVEVSEALVDQTFQDADLDADGLLSCDEFLVLARQHKEQWGDFKTSLFRP
jgi:Ca2+-binding EF-hand superfamily protein